MPLQVLVAAVPAIVRWLDEGADNVALVLAASADHVATILTCVVLLQQQIQPPASGPTGGCSVVPAKRLQLQPHAMVESVLRPYYDVCLTSLTTVARRCERFGFLCHTHFALHEVHFSSLLSTRS